MKTSFIYGFPFLIYLSKVDRPRVKTFEISNVRVRIYPPFLGKDHEINNMNSFDPDKIISFSTKKFKNIKFNKHPLISVYRNELVEISNCLRIDIDTNSRSFNQNEFLSSLVSKLLNHIRNDCDQFEIGSKEFYGDFNIGSFETNKNGDQLSVIIYKTSFHTYNLGKVLNENAWNQIIRKLKEDEEPDIVKTLLLDSYNYLVNQDYSRMILGLSWALEILRDQTLEKIWIILGKEGKFKIGKILTGNNLTDHLDYDFKKICGESFKENLPNDYKTIVNLWSARNNVAHGKKSFYFEDGQKIPIDKINAMIIFEATQKCINWLTKLGKNFGT